MKMQEARGGDTPSGEDREEKGPGAEGTRGQKSPGPGHFSRSSGFCRSSQTTQARSSRNSRRLRNLSCTAFCLLSSGEPPRLFSFFQTLESKLDIMVSERPNLSNALFPISFMQHRMPMRRHRAWKSQLES